LEPLRRLYTLVFWSNQIQEIKGLDRLENFTELDLTGNLISEIKGLDTLLNLYDLDLSRKKIREFKRLHNPNLEELKIRDNPLPKEAKKKIYEKYYKDIY
ncbi:MAG: hypothetical protein KGD61_04200, partial [Candidatus Lokiarchaeota archaeon]|nr:hypothetical protein [Candidatus Lokiarchaeota archaeon]